MLGAAFGNIAGSIYEFKGSSYEIHDFHKHFEKPKTRYTDDTIMTCAVADALIKAGKEAPVDKIRPVIVSKMREWGNRYPYAGYGGRFFGWLQSTDPKPYGSYANGAAMRVSSVGWLYDSLERTLEVAEAVTDVTHNHPDAIDGAKATAAAIFLGRNGKSKEEIMQYIGNEFGYFLGLSVEDVADPMQNNIECVTAVTEALVAFMESESITDAVSKAVYIGGDTDTVGAIAGSIAEAYYGRIDENNALYDMIKKKVPYRIV
jgi:ADP-ribosylglycohydrolase